MQLRVFDAYTRGHLLHEPIEWPGKVFASAEQLKRLFGILAHFEGLFKFLPSFLYTRHVRILYRTICRRSLFLHSSTRMSVSFRLLIKHLHSVLDLSFHALFKRVVVHIIIITFDRLRHART